VPLLRGKTVEGLKVGVLILRFTFQRPSFFLANFTFCLVFYLEFFFFRFPVFVSMVTEVKLQDGTSGSYTK
jgi:hypothetical protein